MLRFLPLFLLLACSPLKTDEKINAKEVNQEIKDRKIKRVVDDEVVSFAYAKGEDVGMRLRTVLPPADSLCLGKDLATRVSQAVLRQAFFRCEGNTSFYHAKEQEIWEAYMQAWAAGTEAGNSIQRLGSKEAYTELLFAMPITYSEGGKAKNGMLSLILSKKELIRIY